MSLEEMALTLDITVCRIERWIKEKLIDRKLISDLAEKPVYAGSSVDLFLRRKSDGSFIASAWACLYRESQQATDGHGPRPTRRRPQGRSRLAQSVLLPFKNCTPEHTASRLALETLEPDRHFIFPAC